ncbi:MAG: hypothetical protein ACM3PF_14890 [Bacteroidota bacterium]
MIGRFGRTARTRVRETALLFLLAGLLAAPGFVAARPYTIDPGPYPADGDPTADDQPSPTPKKASAVTLTNSTVAAPSSQSAPARPTVTSTRRLTYATHLTWDLYLRILSRLFIR